MSDASLSSLAWIGALSLVPLVLVASTSFVKLAFVFSILRNALGTGQVPSGLIITALAAILSAYVMAPVASRAFESSAPRLAAVDWERPFADGGVALGQAWQAASAPLVAFLHGNAGASERGLFVDLAKRGDATQSVVDPNGLLVALPAFLITELKEAFQIGFVVFLPFMVIDLVISNILMALGLTLMPPAAVSLPFKLLLFVLVDGWVVLSQALITGYQI